MAETSLSSLVKEIGEALVLDDSNQDQEAYKKYVSCIYKIATNLIVAIQKSGGHVVVDSKTSKQVKLVQQCVERVSSLLEKMDRSECQPSSPGMQPPSPVVTPTSDSREIAPSNKSPDMKSDIQAFPAVASSALPHQKQLQQWQQPQQPISVVQTNQSRKHPSRLTTPVPSLVIENNPHAYSAHKTHVLTPMEVARRQNQSLMVAYRARMERLNRSDFSAYNYSLTIQRKMAENLAIAQAQEAELARIMQARNLRLEEEAAKRFAAPVGMSKEEQEQRLIYKKILQYEQDATWLKHWRSKLEANSADPILINQLVQEILRCSDHPFTELLHRYQMQIYQRLYPLVANKHEEIDIVQVPLPASAWPSMDDVSDMLTDIQSPGSPNRANPEQIRLCAVTDEGHEMNKESVENKTAGVNASEREPCIDESKNKPKSSDKKCQVIDVNSNLHPLSVQSETKSSEDILVKDKHMILNESQALSDDSHESPRLLQETDKVSTSDSQVALSGVDIEADHENIAFDESCIHKNTEHLNNRHTDPGSEDIEEKTLFEDESVAAESTSKVSDLSDGVSPKEGDAGSSTTAHLAVDHGKELESQVSWERRQAQLLMRQVTKDYNSYKSGDSDYDENKLDYLFDGDDEEDGYEWFSDNTSVQPGYHSIAQQSSPLCQDQGSSLDSGISDASFSQIDNTSVQPGYHSIAQQSSPLCQDQGSSLDSGISDASFSQIDNTSQMESLPSNADLDNKIREDKQFQKLSQEAYLRHLKSISEDIHRFLEKLLVIMIIAYEPLDNPVGKDQCAVSLEEPFFKPIWKTLLRLFRVVNHKEELMLACIMTRFADATPADFKVSQKLWLPDPTCKPYQRAITELKCVREHYTMLNKLECVVKVCRHICECVDDYYSKTRGTGESANHKAPSVGADDLLPILSYVVVQSAMPQLPSECHAMTEFIHEGYMMGEEGYCLTSLRTAVNYIISMFSSLSRRESLS
ncbi:hypothetical protein BsWGS_15849 [Bradybaena similaris]